MKLNLSKRVLIIIFVSVMITFLSVLFVNVKLFLGPIKEKFHEKINILGTEFSKVAALSILLHRSDILEKRANDILNDKDIIGIKVYFKSNNKKFQRGIIKGYHINFPIFTKQLSDNNFFNLEEKVVKLGNVEIYYSRENIKQIMYKIFILSFFISFVIAITIFFFAFKVLNKNFLAPLDFWQKNIENEENLKKYYNEIKEFAPPEIEKLYKAYLEMITKYKENYQKLIHQTTLAEIGKFSLTVAHEIKNPLGIIKGAFDIIKKDNIDVNTKSEMIEYIGEEIVRIDKLIKDFLMMAKNFKLKEKLVDITEFIYSISRKAIINFSGLDINIKIYKNIKVVTDNEILSQIINNLIKNAYEAGADKVDLIVNSREKWWSIVVKDNGNGIIEKNKEKIFDPFFTTKKDGSGIGLTFVVKAVYQLNGNIFFSSREGKGTTFVLKFDLKV